MFLIPITSQQPAQHRVALAIPEIECRRGGLRFPCWAILDEYNHVATDEIYDIESSKPLGAFGTALMQKLAGTMKEAALQKRLKGVRRG